jgi:uracil-DNA glycosylase
VAPATDDPVVAALERLRAEAEACEKCLLSATRTRVVFGEGDPHSDLMFVGEAPGYHEDQQGRPFVGQAGKLLEQLLQTIGLSREQVYIANVLKSRPPNNRDPKPEEIAACEPYLVRQVEIIAPRVVCTLGNFATKLLSGSPTGITRVHGIPQRTRVGSRDLYLYPIFHPAAALYTPAMLETLKQDMLRLPEVLGLPLDGDAAPDGSAVAPVALHDQPPASRPIVLPTLAPETATSPAAETPTPAPPPPPQAQPPQAPAQPPAAQPPAPPRPPATSGPAEQLGLF